MDYCFRIFDICFKILRIYEYVNLYSISVKVMCHNNFHYFFQNSYLLKLDHDIYFNFSTQNVEIIFALESRSAIRKFITDNQKTYIFTSEENKVKCLLNSRQEKIP